MDLQDFFDRLRHTALKRKKATEDLVHGCRGEVVIRIYHGDEQNDDTLYDMIRPNLVVTLARRIMSRLVSGAVNSAEIVTTTSGNVSVPSATSLFVARMKFGSGGHNPASPSQAISPSATDEDLSNPIASPTYKPVTADYPTDKSVRFTATLGTAEGNGPISEEALFTDSTLNLMYARSTFALLNKTSAFSFQFEHTLVW